MSIPCPACQEPVLLMCMEAHLSGCAKNIQMLPCTSCGGQYNYRDRKIHDAECKKKREQETKKKTKKETKKETKEETKKKVPKRSASVKKHIKSMDIGNTKFNK